jgi:hypothetical protein
LPETPDHGLDRLSAGDDAIGKPIDERATAKNGDGDVTPAHGRQSQRLGGQRGEPAVDGAVGVDQADAAGLHEPAQREQAG